MKKIRFPCLLFLFFSMAIVHVFGQVTLRGQLVKDGSKGLISMSYVAVSAKSVATGLASQVVLTDLNGIYTIPGLEYGEYMIQVWTKGLSYSPLTYRITIEPPRTIDLTTFRSSVLGNLNAADQSALLQYYTPNADSSAYTLAATISSREALQAVDRLLESTKLQCYFDVAPINLSPANTSIFEQRALVPDR